MTDGMENNHMFLTLGEAAKQSGLGKATLSRAIAKGKMSAIRSTETNSFKIDPAELHRFTEVLKVVRAKAETGTKERDTTGSDETKISEPLSETAFETRLAIIEERKARELAEMRLADLKAQIATMRDDYRMQIDDMKEQRNKAQAKADELDRRLLAYSAPVIKQEQRGIFSWFARKAG